MNLLKLMRDNLSIPENTVVSEFTEQDLYDLCEKLTKCYTDAGCTLVSDSSHWQFNPVFKTTIPDEVILTFDEKSIHEIITNEGSHPVHSLSYTKSQVELGFNNVFERFKLIMIKPKVNVVSERYPSGGVYRV